jgi:hypothetical protein
MLSLRHKRKKSFIHFYCKMLSVKLHAGMEAERNNEKWKIAEGCDAL